MTRRASLRTAILAMALIPATVTPAKATAVTIGDYYQEGSNRQSEVPPTQSDCGLSISRCHLLFNKVATGKQLLITEVSCRVILPVGAELIDAAIMTQLTTNEMSDRAHWLEPIRLTGTNTTIYVVRASTLQLVKAGERPVIRMQTPSNMEWRVTCAISGKLGNPPE